MQRSGNDVNLSLSPSTFTNKHKSPTTFVNIRKLVILEASAFWEWQRWRSSRQSLSCCLLERTSGILREIPHGNRNQSKHAACAWIQMACLQQKEDITERAFQCKFWNFVLQLSNFWSSHGTKSPKIIRKWSGITRCFFKIMRKKNFNL